MGRSSHWLPRRGHWSPSNSDLYETRRRCERNCSILYQTRKHCEPSNSNLFESRTRDGVKWALCMHARRIARGWAKARAKTDPKVKGLALDFVGNLCRWKPRSNQLATPGDVSLGYMYIYTLGSPPFFEFFRKERIFELTSGLRQEWNAVFASTRM